MKTRMRVTTPADVDVTLQISMPVSDWKRIREKLMENKYDPVASMLGNVISTAITKISAVVEDEQELTQ
jgi:hypothetical protein